METPLQLCSCVVPPSPPLKRPPPRDDNGEGWHPSPPKKIHLGRGSRGSLSKLVKSPTSQPGKKSQKWWTQLNPEWTCLIGVSGEEAENYLAEWNRFESLSHEEIRDYLRVNCPEWGK